MAFKGGLYWVLIDNYQSGNWKELASEIEQADKSTVDSASDYLNVDLYKWYEDFLSKGGETPTTISPPPPREKPPKSPYEKDKKPKVKKKHSEEWYKKKEKQAKGKVAKEAWREAKKLELGAKSAEKYVKGAITTNLIKQRENLKRQLRRLKKVGYNPQLKTGKSGETYKYGASRITALKSEVKYLKKITALSRFHTTPKSLAGRYPKNWMYSVFLTKKQYEKAGLTKMPKEKPILGVSRGVFGSMKPKVLTTLAKEITKVTRKLAKGKVAKRKKKKK